MVKINFEGKPVDFWNIVNFSIKHKIPISIILDQAFQQKVLIDENKKLLLKFIEFLKTCQNTSRSQLLQDLFANFIIKNNFDKTFLEFGATDGKSLSNSYMLENELLWTGTLAEPDIQWIDALKKNRPMSNIITKCIWKKSGEKLSFFSSTNGVFSTLDEFRYSDKKSLPGNSISRNKSGKIIEVETITLNQIIVDEFKNKSPSYISIDTEGSEFEILNVFNFSKYKPAVFTIEHNFSELQYKIDQLMIENDYLRIFKRLTSFDAWYISRKAMNKLEEI